jgi:hypothetical protein
VSEKKKVGKIIKFNKSIRTKRKLLKKRKKKKTRVVANDAAETQEVARCKSKSKSIK